MHPGSTATQTDPAAGIAAPRLERVLGTHSAGLPGPEVVVTAGVHGNEPAGTAALERVFRHLGEWKPPLRGRLLGLSGNLAALAHERRFMSRDLNRGWTDEGIAALVTRGPDADRDEDGEQRALLGQFAAVFARAREPAVFLDLHSTSAGGAPFCVIGDTLRNRRVAFALPIPIVLGLEETIDGTLNSWLDDLGHVAVVVEGGQNEDPATVDHHESAIWLTLAAVGSLRREEVPDYEMHRTRLAAAAAGIPHVVEIRHREAIAAEDRFVMEPGYANFQPVKKDELLAHDRRGPIRSHENARILMPLYQVQGNDGFFLVRPVRTFWLHVATACRKLRLHRLLPLLPGVRWHRQKADTLVVNKRVARWFVIEVFHLFGFRRVHTEGDRLVFTRRRPGWRKLVKVELGNGGANDQALGEERSRGDF